ncbi:MAG: hypothetical protein Q9O74_08465 [Planctomycetota bacterium]|nr:hypothetical protein [Planctomycetota bacterium]
MSPIETAGLSCPPEMYMLPVMKTASVNPCASATVIRLPADPALSAVSRIDPASKNASANVPMYSAIHPLISGDMRCVPLLWAGCGQVAIKQLRSSGRMARAGPGRPVQLCKPRRKARV